MEKTTQNFKLKLLVKIGNEYLKMNFLMFPGVGSIMNLASAYFKYPGSKSLICQDKLKVHSLFKGRPPFCSPIFSRKKMKMPRHLYLDFLSEPKSSVEGSSVPQCLIPTFIVSWPSGRTYPAVPILTPYVKTQ